MKQEFRPSLPWFLAFLCACFVLSELHEQVHIQTGYLLYSGYGPRDFNLWQTARSDGYRWIATLAGPLFSFACMWTGLWISRRRPGPGIALLFAALPFARLLTALMGGGDEKVVLLALSGNETLGPALRVILATVVLLCAGLPVLLATCRFRLRAPMVVLLLVLPLLIEYPLTHTLYNRLLHQGFGARVFFGGTPWLIQLHFVGMASLLWLLRRQLFLSHPQTDQAPKREGRPQATLTP
ncbi:hypothetical protein [Flaviaesturariibacter aridisoli]|uniref:Uncharacterized protein n=1 Tax=Flaviaesturariibacter aridisoli TaxID=2545761 RepID=A0A4R4DZW9_9BACT|nr:hypothetical protein [Flaviaesturariibacter aridisoli]TCZ72274.1 hypothetical protein E0486_09300 [Flaviaesturariibacter aridisoli]